VQHLLERLNQVGFERTRRAIAALALSLFVFLYAILALNAPIEGWTPAFLGLSVCYGVAFMGVAAEWFWGRWFATGLAWSGVMVAIAGMVQIGGWMPVLGIYGGLHGLMILTLSGKKMAERFDQQPAWRERFDMDEFGVARLRKTVTRASASLPSMILWALAPKEPGQGMAIAAIVAAALAVTGLGAVVRLRTWGLVALGAAATLVLATGDVLGPSMGLATSMPAVLGLGPTLTAAFLAVAVVPFIRPAARYLARR
jgi:hypothetical protein